MSDVTVTFANETQAALFQLELLGQFSDGQWENKPNNPWNPWKQWNERPTSSSPLAITATPTKPAR